MASRKRDTRAEAEALQEPAFDPIMLLASALSGGLSAIPEGLENRQLKNQALDAFMKEDWPSIKDVLSSVYMETPSLLKTVGKGISAAAGRFTGANALANYVDPNHPTVNNLWALANVPSMNVEKMPRLVQLLKRLQAQMDVNLDPNKLP